MKKHQFEEITAALSLLICLAAYSLDIKWLFYIYAIKAVGDFYQAIKAAVKSIAKKNRKKKSEKQINK